MHFALPPRKSSHPPPYERAFKSSPIRRKQLQLGATIACAALILIWLCSRLMSSSPDRPPAGTPEAVVVTMLDPDSMSKEYMNKIKENRIDYADRYGSCDRFPLFPTIETWGRGRRGGEVDLSGGSKCLLCCSLSS